MAAPRYFVRETTERLVYRDGKGRFVSKERAISEGLLPTVQTRTEYRTREGKFVSEEKVKRSKRRIVDVVRDKKGNIVEGSEAFKIQGKKIPVPQFNDILGQQMRGKLSEAISNGDRIGFIFKGRFYQVSDTRFAKIQEAWIRLSNAAVYMFKREDSLYYTVGIAEGPDSLVIDFDSILPSEMERDSQEFEDLRRDYYRMAAEQLRDFLI